MPLVTIPLRLFGKSLSLALAAFSALPGIE
jgi:hypothetical protein